MTPGPCRCRLAAEFVRGATPAEAAADPPEVEGWLHQDELYGLMSSVNGIRGGWQWFLAGIDRFPHLYEQYDRGKDTGLPG
jgi:hypothetical protein